MRSFFYFVMQLINEIEHSNKFIPWYDGSKKTWMSQAYPIQVGAKNGIRAGHGLSFG
ncbi:hypothetical protein D3C77_402640 [compost metagenome]